jgi:guanylate kinase
MTEVQGNARIFVFTGTSGAGRKTIARMIASELAIHHVRSYTTRVPRKRELHPYDYHYINETAFKQCLAQDEFIQSVKIHQHWYGTKRNELLESLTAQGDVYLVLNREGSEAIKHHFGNRVIRLFIYVNKHTLQERLEAKGASYDMIDQYLQDYHAEVTYRSSCEHVFENMDLSQTALAVRKAIIDAYL